MEKEGYTKQTSRGKEKVQPSWEKMSAEPGEEPTFKSTRRNSNSVREGHGGP